MLPTFSHLFLGVVAFYKEKTKTALALSLLVFLPSLATGILNIVLGINRYTIASEAVSLQQVVRFVLPADILAALLSLLLALPLMSAVASWYTHREVSAKNAIAQTRGTIFSSFLAGIFIFLLVFFMAFIVAVVLSIVFTLISPFVAGYSYLWILVSIGLIAIAAVFFVFTFPAIVLDRLRAGAAIAKSISLFQGSLLGTFFRIALPSLLAAALVGFLSWVTEPGVLLLASTFVNSLFDLNLLVGVRDLLVALVASLLTPLSVVPVVILYLHKTDKLR